jgi:TIR domain
MTIVSAFEIFISHVNEDEPIAILLRKLLIDVFPDASVFIAGSDVRGGDLWPESLRARLEAADVVIALISRKSLASGWVHFEAGAGFVDSSTIPVCADGVVTDTLDAPLGLLQARNLDIAGVEALLGDLAARQPQTEEFLPSAHETVLESTVRSVGRFVTGRARSEPLWQGPEPQRSTVNGSEPVTIRLGAARCISEEEGFHLLLVPTELHNNTDAGYTVASLWHAVSPAETLNRPVSLHEEADGGVCVGYTSTTGESLHCRQPDLAIGAFLFPRDLHAREKLTAVMSLAVRPNLEMQEDAEILRISIGVRAFSSGGQVLGELMASIEIS